MVERRSQKIEQLEEESSRLLTAYDLIHKEQRPRDLSGSIPEFVAADALKVVGRKEWREMPSRGYALWVRYSDAPVLTGRVFHPNSWTRANNTLIDIQEEPSTHHVRDRRRFRAAIINLPEKYDVDKLNILLDRLIPRLGREKGNSEIDKIAKAAPVFLLAPEGHKEDLLKFLNSREDLFAANAVEKGKKGKKFTVAEARIRRESDMPHVNLRENSAKKDYDYLEVGLQRVATSFKRLDPRIKEVKFESEFLGKNGAEERLRHSNNYLRDIKAALAGIGVELEYHCGCRIARYREGPHMYTVPLGSCPSGNEIDPNEVPSYEDLKIFGGYLRGKSPQEFHRALDENIFLPESPNNPIATLIKRDKNGYECPDKCGNRVVIDTFAARVGDVVSLINTANCPTSKRFFGKAVNKITPEEFIKRYS